MSFNDFLNQAWSDHATKTKEVAERFNNGIQLIENNQQIPLLAGLITHVMGEHLGEWENGIQILKKLRDVPSFDQSSESEQALIRSIASLQVASGINTNIKDLSVSNQVRVLAVAAAALCEKDTLRAQTLFRESLKLAETGIERGDAANRALAITGNNLACALEEKTSRTPDEKALMIIAAEAARKHWEIAAGWLEIERAEYRLAHTYLKAGYYAKSIHHAKKCIEVSEKNSANPLELFFGYEALALAEAANKNPSGFSPAVEKAQDYFEVLPDNEKNWCVASLKKLREQKIE